MEQGVHEVLTALVALRDDLPGVVEGLRRGSLPVTSQREVAAALIEAGDLLDEHADQQAAMSNGHTNGLTAIDDVSAWSEHDE
ncbi:hypothetical protein SacmaDRAFT_4047 [Saccharomonospora marina XMU15]|uniref:Uncharacterized protein n=1 Tax=Saccharomonospora marina XMU15 TaxID=882083 RepID=H5X4W3_9PSEU|nr:hypothetical protein [Saccharomonospora marina]EHR52242.1 hypothetical protein SacmaDRAFT_4047 [Saccharomonospora marina XMU15]